MTHNLIVFDSKYSSLILNFSSMYILLYLNKIRLNSHHITQVGTLITLVIKTTTLQPPPRPQAQAGVDGATILTSITALVVAE